MESRPQSCQEHPQCQESHCSSGKGQHKRQENASSSRILKHHDLDTLLIYNKRTRNKPATIPDPLYPPEKNKMPKKAVKIAKIQQKLSQQTQKLESEAKLSLQSSQKSENKATELLSEALPLPQQRRIVSKNQKPKTKNAYYSRQDSEQSLQPFRFPFVNEYILSHGDLFLGTMQKIDQGREVNAINTNDTYLNCDVRYFNWELFIQEVGKFDVMIIDPPWRIKGAQQNDSQFMFSNCKFSLEYSTMGNNEIARLPLNLISDQGFIFLWILNSQLDSSIEIMENWGYQLVDEIIWIKLRDEKVNLTHGYYFMHSFEICLVGYKNKSWSPKMKMRMNKLISNNTLFAQVQKKSQKPEDLYSIIEIMFPGKKKVEIFARNHNLRYGLFSMGNELGESYDKWKVTLNCDNCSKPIQHGVKRYKSKHEANYDVCATCVTTMDQELFFELNNEVHEDVRHEYISCNHCKAEPIWGNKFTCLQCLDFDLCENCLDKNLESKEKFHPIDHEFKVIEVPVFGNGYAIHEYKCSSCYQNPIIGVCLNCTSCKSFKLCQKCFFERSRAQLTANSRSHREDHELEAIFEPQYTGSKRYDCFQCKKQILHDCWMCENCYNFFFCEDCYLKRDSFKSMYANAHKKYHIYSKLF